MLISLLGTCRLQCIRDHLACTRFDEELSFLHCTKEIIQFIQYLQGDSQIPEPLTRYCFRTGIGKKQPIAFHPRFKEQYDQTDLFAIEVCSSRKYQYQGVYLHHLATDERLGNYKNTPRAIRNDVEVSHQSPQEIKQDLAEIQRLLAGKKILLVSHINAKVNQAEKPAGANNWWTKLQAKWTPQPDPKNIQWVQLPRRVELIKLVRETANELGIDFMDPSTVLDQYPQEQIMLPERWGTPPGHYTPLGMQVIGKMYADKIREILSR